MHRELAVKERRRALDKKKYLMKMQKQNLDNEFKELDKNETMTKENFEDMRQAILTDIDSR